MRDCPQEGKGGERVDPSPCARRRGMSECVSERASGLMASVLYGSGFVRAEVAGAGGARDCELFSKTDYNETSG